jgi:hypothetical protein
MYLNDVYILILFFSVAASSSIAPSIKSAFLSEEKFASRGKAQNTNRIKSEGRKKKTVRSVLWVR